MENKQSYTDIQSSQLHELARRYCDKGYRLAQMCATRKDKTDLLYTFALDGELQNLRLVLEDGQSVDSISGIYSYAFLYENEIKELYGVDITDMNIDFKGQFYKVAISTPFNPQEGEV